MRESLAEWVTKNAGRREQYDVNVIFHTTIDLLDKVAEAIEFRLIENGMSHVDAIAVVGSAVDAVLADAENAEAQAAMIIQQLTSKPPYGFNMRGDSQ